VTQTSSTPISVETGYAPVRGLNLYYEIHGSGAPLVLLHGGAVGIEMFGPNLSELARTRRVVAVELQGHGRTADVDRPLSYADMADDVAALLDYLGIKPADVLGLSLGGGVALQTAIRHPDLVRKLVVVSAPCKRAGWYPEVLAAFDRMGPADGEPLRHSPLAERYPQVDWPTLFAKIGELQRQDYDWSKDVAALEAPTLLVFADADAVRPSHIVEFYGLLGGGQRDAGPDGRGRSMAQLAILPGLTHYNISASPALAAVVAPFLDAPLP
jgi:pimeloyl-ACP methyl ester carboxylesterase